jgi:hypothetical protein
MKPTIRLPLGQFEFIEMTYEEQMSPNEAVEAFNALKRAYTDVPEGLTSKEMDTIIEHMALGTSVEGGTELWAKASVLQKEEINRLKRALKRIEARQAKEEDEEGDSMYGSPGKGENGDYSSMD